MSGRINVGRPRRQQGVPDFPGDGPDEIRTVCGPEPCFCCGRHHEFNMTFEESRVILLATPWDRSYEA